MKLHHLRNATALLQLGPHRLLIDPMLSGPGDARLQDVWRRPSPKPLVPLPPSADEALSSATGAIITHEHPDHLDSPGVAWLVARGLTVWAAPTDVVAPARSGPQGRALDRRLAWGLTWR
ncbi:MAG: MBL fold metallo-hydrolase [Deltaproteobacteria bacterium]|nr:MBL fold metallo-hydrolase [Deltaproteobacteria bacterium]